METALCSRGQAKVVVRDVVIAQAAACFLVIYMQVGVSGFGQIFWGVGLIA